MKYLLLLLLIPNVAFAWNNCGDYEVPTAHPPQTDLEVMFCSDLFFCTDLTYELNNRLVKEIQTKEALQQRLKRYREIIRKLRRRNK